MDWLRQLKAHRAGYALRVRPCNITIGQVLRVLKGSFIPVECLDDIGNYEHSRGFVARKAWQKLQLAMEQAMDSLTLQDMLNDCSLTNAGQGDGDI